MGKFILFYTDPAKEGLQRLQVVVLILLIPVAAFYGVKAWKHYQRFDRARNYLLEADAYAHQGRTRAAIDRAWKCVETYPEMAGGYDLIASLEYLQGDREAAIAAYRKGLEVLPHQGEFYLSIAQLLALRGDSEEALSHADRARELLPGDPRVETLRQYITHQAKQR